VRILHVITRADVGGAQTHVLELATAQRAAGHDVAIAAGSLGAMAATATARGIRVIELTDLVRSVSVLSDVRAIGHVRDVLVAERPDVVHAHSSKAGLLVRLAARRARVPAVYTAHGWPFQRGARLPQRVASWTGELVAGRWWGRVICLTDAERRRARRARVAAAGRLHVVANGLPDVDAGLHHRHDADAAIVRIVMVARFALPKDQPGVIRALAAVADDPRWAMRFIGDGPLIDESRALVEGLGLSHRIELTGDRDDVPQLLAEADVCVLWSRYEGMPLALLEAMRAGLACVSNDLPGSRSLFGPDAGVIVPFDESALAETVRALVDDGRRRRDLGRRARDRFVDAFTIDAVSAATDEVYRLAINDVRR
jgi:glycosyltransferase involved in cell wall biosynthesis